MLYVDTRLPGSICYRMSLSRLMPCLGVPLSLEDEAYCARWACATLKKNPTVQTNRGLLRIAGLATVIQQALKLPGHPHKDVD